MTKKDAAAMIFYVSERIRESQAGDEDAETWIVKLRRLIEHPATPPGEREAAVRALARIRGATT